MLLCVLSLTLSPDRTLHLLTLRAGSMKRSTVRPSVRLSHRSTAAAAGLLLSAPRTGDIDRLLHGAPAMLRSLSALSSKCGQRHVDSRRRRLNTDLLVRNELCSRPLTDRPEENDRKSSAYNVFSVHDARFESNSDFGMTQIVNRRQFGHYYYAPAVGGDKRYRDPSVSLSQSRL